jgi:DNA-binding NarL/FixJ family response regulator
MAGQLSARETEVLTLAARGHSYKEIASRLGISALTARNHLTNIYSKLGIHDRAGAALYALRLGLVEV